MSPHPPLITRDLAVRPRTVLFTVEELRVERPKCKAVRTYKLKTERPTATAGCPSCSVPWTWKGQPHV